MEKKILWTIPSKLPGSTDPPKSTPAVFTTPNAPAIAGPKFCPCGLEKRAQTSRAAMGKNPPIPAIRSIHFPGSAEADERVTFIAVFAAVPMRAKGAANLSAFLCGPWTNIPMKRLDKPNPVSQNPAPSFRNATPAVAPIALPRHKFLNLSIGESAMLYMGSIKLLRNSAKIPVKEKNI